MVKYEELTPEEFDAIVTGELNHYAIWFENRLNAFFVSYFGTLGDRKDDFYSFFLRREGLKFQDKIEIARGMLKAHAEHMRQSQRSMAKDVVQYLKQTSLTLNKVEKFKQLRNALAHGMDVARSEKDSEPKVDVEIVQRSGKPRVFQITPNSHQEMMAELEALLKDLNQNLNRLENWFRADVIEEMKGQVSIYS